LWHTGPDRRGRGHTHPNWWPRGFGACGTQAPIDGAGGTRTPIAGGVAIGSDPRTASSSYRTASESGCLREDGWVPPLRRVDRPCLLDGATQQLRRHRTGRYARPAFGRGRRAARGHRRRRRGQARRSRGYVRVSRQASRPPFGTRLGVLAVPADVGAGLAAVGHQQAGRERDTAQRALDGRHRTVPVVTLRSHR